MEWAPKIGERVKCIAKACKGKTGVIVSTNNACFKVKTDGAGGHYAWKELQNIARIKPKQEAPEYCCFSCAKIGTDKCDCTDPQEQSQRGCSHYHGGGVRACNATGCEGLMKGCWQRRDHVPDTKKKAHKPVATDAPPEATARRQREEAERAEKVCVFCNQPVCADSSFCTDCNTIMLVHHIEIAEHKPPLTDIPPGCRPGCMTRIRERVRCENLYHRHERYPYAGRSF